MRIRKPSLAAAPFLVWCLLATAGATAADPTTARDPVVFVDSVLRSVWAAPEGGVVAVGHTGVYRDDGEGWVKIFDRDKLVRKFPADLWGSDSGDLFVVTTAGQVLRFHGTDWTVADMGVAFLLGVWGSAPDDVFAVGDAGTVLHFDGRAWSPMASGSDAKLQAVWGSSSSAVVAVGTEGTVIRFDGETWIEDDAGTDTVLSTVWGRSAEDVFAGGGGGLVLHFDGHVWTEMETATRNQILGISGTPGGPVFAVTRRHEILRLDGEGWSLWARTPETFWPMALTVTPAGDVVVVGFQGQPVLDEASGRAGFSSGTGAILRLAADG